MHGVTQSQTQLSTHAQPWMQTVTKAPVWAVLYFSASDWPSGPASEAPDSGQMLLGALEITGFLAQRDSPGPWTC